MIGALTDLLSAGVVREDPPGSKRLVLADASPAVQPAAGSGGNMRDAADEVRGIVQQLIVDVLLDGQHGDGPSGMGRREPTVNAILAALAPAQQGEADDGPEKALEGAKNYGIGFVVDGKRVSPDRVTVCRGDAQQGDAEAGSGRLCEAVTTTVRRTAFNFGNGGVGGRCTRRATHFGQSKYWCAQHAKEPASVLRKASGKLRDGVLPLEVAAHPPAQASESGAGDWRLRAALKPFAEIAGDYQTGGLQADLDQRVPILMRRLKAVDFHRARAALSTPQAAPGEGEGKR